MKLLIIEAVISIILAYLCIAFILWELNPSHFRIVDRVITLPFGGMIFCIINIIKAKR